MQTDDEAERLQPIHPLLAEAIASFDDVGLWAVVYDHKWRLVAQTTELAAVAGDSYVGDVFRFGPAAVLESPTGATLEQVRVIVRQVGTWMLEDLEVDEEGLPVMLHPALRDLVDELDLDGRCGEGLGGFRGVSARRDRRRGADAARRDSHGHVVGTVHLTKPHIGMNMIAMLTVSGDLDHLQRIHGLAVASRRPAAVLFADLEGSAQLSKRLSTATYFALIRRMTRAADKCVINHGGLVGRHIGDGVAAFFVTEGAESESAAARIMHRRSEGTASLDVGNRRSARATPRGPDGSRWSPLGHQAPHRQHRHALAVRK